MAPSVDATAVNFYTKKDFEGDKFPYSIGDDISVPTDLNDKFLSVNVGVAAKVIAWQHYNSTGIYKEWTGENPDISEIEGLSRFKVVDNDTRAITFIFKDATGGADKQYSLKLNAADVGTILIYSNDGDDYHLVGIMPSGGPPVVTAIYVRDESTGVYIATGSVFFQWNSASKQVDIVESDNWPPQLKYERSGPSSFIVTLIDNKPSE
ncbi:hypothetical protein GQX73_g10826 [Xylaria multiplex]|uniref:Calcium-dependent cell adhesion molecule 1 membrane-binding domain-containing protein n=1 Tax=Xylaria multiplex TaxID=323545 RepID=A0A7C8IKP9_9PEZI|nr:hypothetical protein GQX73_g10826 [Xylaria multiplex]